MANPLSADIVFVGNHKKDTPITDTLFSADDIGAYLGVITGGSAATSVADSKGVSAGAFAQVDATSASVADSKAVSAAVLANTASFGASVADSKATSDSGQAVVADSKGVSAGAAASVADSKALSVSLNTSIADSKAVSAAIGGGGAAASTADSKAESASLRASVADSRAVSDSVTGSTTDSKAVSNSINISVADSKAVSAGSGGGGGGDPYWNDTLLLMHMDGTDGGTTFTDTAMGVTVTRTIATTSTTAPKYGTAAALFSAGSKLSIPSSTMYALDQNDFCLELYAKWTDTTLDAALITRDNAAFNGGSWALLVNDVTAGDVAFYAIDFGGSAKVLLSSTAGFNDGAWHHIRVVRTGVNFSMYIDGVEKARAVSIFQFAANTNPILIGNDGAANRDYVGRIDEVRLTIGSPRSTRAFTALTAAFPSTQLVSAA